MKPSLSVVEAKLLKHQYLFMRQEEKTVIVICIHPTANTCKAKIRYYPPHDTSTITEISTEIQLQAILHHTSRRLHDLQKPVLITLDKEQLKNLILLVE
ncbi:hypothetical protein JTB14_010347 [Gonioctena quinquepunctata]|nr:hypothetical protein JTB14_010347 [Gonioctena quinquepunctata]